MFTEKRKKGIITVFALLLAALVAGGVFSVSAKYTTKLSETNTYVQVSLKLDPNYTGATDTEWRTVSPVNGQAMPTVTIPVRTGYIFTGYYSADGTAGHEQNDGNRYYKNDGTSYKNWDASCNKLYAGWEGTHSITFNATENDGVLSGTNPLYVKYNDEKYYIDSTGTTEATALPAATHSGLTFVGWYTQATGGTLIIDKDGAIQSNKSGFTNSGAKWILEEDKILYAHYAAEVAFDDGIGTYSGTNPLYAKYNDSKLFSDSDATNETSVPVATHAALRFVGWFTAATGGTPIIDKNGNILPDKTGYTDASGNWIMHNTITLYAQHAAKITFDAGENGGTIKETTDTEKELYARYSDSSLYVSAETNASKADEVPLAEYDDTHLFKGWYSAKTGGIQIIDKDGNVLTNKAGYTDAAGKWIPEEDKTLFAQFDVIHTVSFVNMTSSSGTLVETYYEFNGVLYNESTLNTRVTSMPSASNGSRTGLSYWTTTKTGKVGSGSSAAAAPVVISAGNVVTGTYTDENGQTFTIGGTSDWTLNSNITLYAVWYKINYYKDTKQIPKTAGYIELEYIASTSGGGQYINTGVNPQSYETDFVLRAGMRPTNLSEAGGLSESLYFFGTSELSAMLYRKITFTSYYRAQFRVGWAGYDIEHPLDEVRYNYDVSYKRYSATVNRDNVYVGSVDWSSQWGKDNRHCFDNTYLTFFKAGNGYAAVELYCMTLKNGNTVLKNYVPAKNSSGTLGVYDTLSGSFVTNSGSGTFICNQDYQQLLIYGEPVTIAYSPADCNYTHYQYDTVSGQEKCVEYKCDGWTYEMGRAVDDYVKDATISYENFFTHISSDSTAGNIFVNLYTGVWEAPASAPPRLTSMFHSGDKSTEYVYVEPTTEEGVDLIEEENINE